MCNFNNFKVTHSIQLFNKQLLLCNHMPVLYSNTIAQLLGILQSHRQCDCPCRHCACLCHWRKGTTRSKKQVNATQEDKKKKKKPQKKEKELNATQIKEKPDHAMLSWTVCYNNSCLIHLSEKQGSRWFSGSKGQLYATHHQGKELKEHFQQHIDTLQEQMEELEVQYPSSRKAKIEWKKEILISSFVLKSKPFDIKDLVSLQPKLQREDATLSEIGESRVSRWLEESKPSQV